MARIPYVCDVSPCLLRMKEAWIRVLEYTIQVGAF